MRETVVRVRKLGRNGRKCAVSVDQAALIWQNVTEDMPIVVYKN